MIKKMNKVFVLILCLIAYDPVNAQSIINDVIGSAGMHGMSANGVQLSWTIGEPITETASNNTWILTQGFHQSWQSQSTSIQSDANTPLIVQVYPNPVRELLSVSLENNHLSLLFDLYDISGRLIRHQESGPQQSMVTFPIRWLSAGSYLLRITTKDYTINESYRLQKLR